MNNVSQAPDLRVMVASYLPCNLAVPVLVALLDQDLVRLSAINKIMCNLSAQSAQASLDEINATLSLLGLRDNGASDQLWCTFDPLPLGSYRGRPGTLSLFATIGDGNVIMLSPGARLLDFGAKASEQKEQKVEHPALLVPALALNSRPTSVEASQALSQIRATLVQRLANVDWAQDFGD